MPPLTQKHKNIIKLVKQEKLYPTYRAYLNYCLKKCELTKWALDSNLLNAIKQENMHEIIRILHKVKTNVIMMKDTSITNFQKFYFVKTKGDNILVGHKKS